MVELCSLGLKNDTLFSCNPKQVISNQSILEAFKENVFLFGVESPYNNHNNNDNISTINDIYNNNN